MTDPLVQRARDLDGKATPGPWTYELEDGYYEDTWRIILDEPTPTTHHYVAACNTEGQVADAEFIAAARTEWPALAEAYETLEAANRGLGEMIEAARPAIRNHDRVVALNTRLTAALRNVMTLMDTDDIWRASGFAKDARALLTEMGET